MAARFTSTSTSKSPAPSKPATDDTHIVWLDNQTDSPAQIREQFQTLTNSVIIEKPEQCFRTVHRLVNQKVYLVLPGGLGKTFVPAVHELVQVQSIVIFCGNKQFHEQWASKYPKIRGVFVHLDSLYDCLKQLIARTTSPVQALATGNADDFVYTEILLEILSSIDFHEDHRCDFLDYARETFEADAQALKLIQQFASGYRPEQAIDWYTQQTFVYKLLKKAFESKDANLIGLMGFFILDLHRSIQQAREKPSKRIDRVYRPERRSPSELDALRKTEHGYFSLNRFFTAQPRPPSSSSESRPNSINTLFSINLGSSASSYAVRGDLVLFSIDAFFRLERIHSTASNACTIELTLVDNREEELRVHFEQLRYEISQRASPWYQLALLFLRINPQLTDYRYVLKHISNDSERFQLAYQIGLIFSREKQYKQARDHFQNLLRQEKSPKTRALVLNQLAFVHQQLNDLSEALTAYQTLLEIHQQNLPANHPDLSATYFHLGELYERLGNSDKAFVHHQKALGIRQNTLPANHPDLIASQQAIDSMRKKK